MIFLRYESMREYRRLYPITSAVLLINILLFIIVSLNGGTRNPEALIKFGALVNHPQYSGELWRYISSMFLHIGFEHLLFNGFALFVFAPPLERLLGPVKYTLFYIGSGLVGNVASMLLMVGFTVSAGASGAIYGIFGAYIFMVLYRRNMLDHQSRKTVIIILVIGVFYTFINPIVNIYAHFGGFIGGILCFALLHKVR